MLKRGDKIRVRQNLVHGKIYGGLAYHRSMGTDKGYLTVVNIVVNTLIKLSNGWDYTPEMLEETDRPDAPPLLNEVNPMEVA